MIKNDKWIQEKAKEGMIQPFVPSMVREIEHCKPPSKDCKMIGAISFGLGSYGYDIRLSPHDFKTFRHLPGTVVDPKNFNPDNLESAPLHCDDNGNFFILPAHSYGLGVAVERLEVPDNVTILCLGKSTYARTGIIANITPAEAAWEGYLTLEFSNSSSADCRIYAGEGVVQLLFFEGDSCSVSYEDRQGKYQGQGQEIVEAKL